MYLSILLPSILALYALYKKKLTLPGIVLAWAFGFIITYYGGLLTSVALIITILLILITDKIKKNKDDATRTIHQIIGNLLMPTVCIIIYVITNNQQFYILYFIVLAAALGDTLAGNIGVLSKQEPINLFSGKKLKRGEPGGVSYLGLMASLFGGLLMSIIMSFRIFNLWWSVIIIMMGLIGSLIDTVIGTKIQAHYYCNKCKMIVEMDIHCENETKYLRGYHAIDNNMVNLLANITVFIIGYLILLI